MINTILKTNDNYEKMIYNYSIRDGIKAITFYFVVIAFCFLQGILFLSSFSSSILDFSQIAISIIDVLICFLFICLSKESIESVGITSTNIRISVIFGIIGSLAISAIFVLIGLVNGTIQFTYIFQMQSIKVVILFIMGAIAEEIVFRGYIQTRIYGIIKNKFIGSFITSLLFLSIHYPVKWVVSGTVYFTALSVFHVIFLILLHFACDFVYKKTNCIWGAVVLHTFYNLITAMLIIG